MPVQLYTVDEAAQRLNTTTRFVRRLIAERRIPFTRLGRHVRIAGDDLDAFVAQGRVDVVPPKPRRPVAPPRPRRPYGESTPAEGSR